jgi:hypothetical protein
MKYTFVAKTSSGLVKAWATGKDKKGTKEYCLKQLKIGWIKKWMKPTNRQNTVLFK